MILTFLYAIATSIQSRRILFLKAHIRNLFQGNATNYPSIMFYNKTLVDSCKESKSPMDDCESEEFMTSSVCSNKSDAKLENLLWYHGDMRLCTIYPQQKVDISSWLTYQYGRTFFPLHTTNATGSSFQPEYKLYILVEADLESFKPTSTTKATKVEEYGLIITWTANKNIDLIIETDLDTLVKFFIASMEGQCYINNGLLLKRIQTVLISGKPCFYNNDILNAPPAKRFIDKTEWESHVEKLRILSDSARLATEQCKSLEVADFPGVVIYPDDTTTDSVIERMQRIASTETLETENSSRASTTDSINIPQQDNQRSSNATDIDKEDTTLRQEVSRSASKSLDTLDTREESDINKLRPTSCIDIKATSVTAEQKPIFSARDSKSIPRRSNFKGSMAEVTEKLSSKNVKPPNVLIFADSIIALGNVRSVLEESLGTSRYTITALSSEEARNNLWVDDAALVVVCGNVGNEIGNQIVEYILRGGKLLALCSDVLHILLPSFKTAEVRENELVHFSYGKWKHVRMMHHIFCYQASPVRTRFSQDHEDVKVSSLSTPTSTNVKDKKGNSHLFDVKVLGTEETWHTPSILLASPSGNVGKIVFSQIHLEVDPMQYELEESKFRALKESNAARIEILNDLLNVHLGIELRKTPSVPATYSPAFFLGRHELKLDMLSRLKDKMESNDTLKQSNLQIQFCRGNTCAQPASASFLPIMVHQCPENFSTIEYFENLTTTDLGRLVIYVDVITSSMYVTNGLELHHGLAVIPAKQTKAMGRDRNQWLSPEGCAMFTLQMHIPTASILGQRLSLLQHLMCVAIVSGIKSLPGYEDIDLTIKWPNDVYVGKSFKIGGINVKSTVTSDVNICDVGVGVNLFNSEPVGCINDLVKLFNKTYNKQLKTISYEQYFAIVFNETERWLNTVQSGSMDEFLDAYYEYWNHDDQEVTISRTGSLEKAKVLGIDDYGYLRVRGEDGSIFTVHPDGNRFDLLKGLITPK
ncbi:holocarboxylase synthetase-like protein isoform X1 [Halictus rubicundus]|uniref:holocarboxylase synthetase-like protein isoform X1 n=3 Tax=Halictus rubicundus TaxID=77578 RepID=UPI00403509D6